MQLEMRKDEVIAFEDGLCGIIVEGLRGILWITVEGDSRDRILKAGDRFTVLSKRKVVVSACEDSSVLFAPALEEESLSFFVKRDGHPSCKRRAAAPA